MTLPAGFSSHKLTCNDQTIHFVAAGAEDAPVILFLHGFPEYWAAWQPVFEHLLDEYSIIAPDQRGFNLSSRPAGVEAYQVNHLVADMVALIGQVSPDQPVILCGHDWGASIAYAMAIWHPHLIKKLVIANGVHPMCFQQALLAGGAQTDASQYIHRLRQKGIEERLAANGFQHMFAMFDKFSATPWLDEAAREGYRTAWSHPGALAAMLNWYRASPLIVPEPGSPPKEMQITDKLKTKFAITMPHLLIWGMKDPALLPQSREKLGQFCRDLKLVEVKDGDHWLLHTHDSEIATEIRQFVAD